MSNSQMFAVLDSDGAMVDYAGTRTVALRYADVRTSRTRRPHTVAPAADWWISIYRTMVAKTVR